MAFYVDGEHVLGIYIKIGSASCYIKIKGDDTWDGVETLAYYDMSDVNAFVEMVGDELLINVERFDLVDKLPDGFVEVILDKHSVAMLMEAYR